MATWTYFQGGVMIIRLGDTDVEFDEKFRLYLSCKQQNPHFLPHICILVTLVNFTISTEGIEQQILA